MALAATGVLWLALLSGPRGAYRPIRTSRSRLPLAQLELDSSSEIRSVLEILSALPAAPSAGRDLPGAPSAGREGGRDGATASEIAAASRSSLLSALTDRPSDNTPKQQPLSKQPPPPLAPLPPTDLSLSGVRSRARALLAMGTNTPAERQRALADLAEDAWRARR